MIIFDILLQFNIYQKQIYHGKIEALLTLQNWLDSNISSLEEINNFTASYKKPPCITNTSYLRHRKTIKVKAIAY